MTLFDVICLGGIGAGVGMGATLGNRAFGVAGGWVGGILGGLVGLAIGRAPLVIALWASERTLARKSEEELRAQLREQYFMAHQVMAELVRRGADLAAERAYILELLTSDSADRRRFGLAALRIGFPETALHLEDYRASESPTSCREKVARVIAPPN